MLSKRSIRNITRRQERLAQEVEAGEAVNPLVVSAELRLAVEIIKRLQQERTEPGEKLPVPEPIKVKEEQRECPECFGTQRVLYSWGFGTCPRCSGAGYITEKKAQLSDNIEIIE